MFVMIVQLYCGVNSMEANNSMLSSTAKNNAPVMLQSNGSMNGRTDGVQQGEKDLSQVMKWCNESYQIPISKKR